MKPSCVSAAAAAAKTRPSPAKDGNVDDDEDEDDSDYSAPLESQSEAKGAGASSRLLQRLIFEAKLLPKQRVDSAVQATLAQMCRLETDQGLLQYVATDREFGLLHPKLAQLAHRALSRVAAARNPASGAASSLTTTATATASSLATTAAAGAASATAMQAQHSQHHEAVSQQAPQLISTTAKPTGDEPERHAPERHQDEPERKIEQDGSDGDGEANEANNDDDDPDASVRRISLALSTALNLKINMPGHSNLLVGLSCDVCFAMGRHYCARCRTARYCSSACQKGAWSTHKKECAQLCHPSIQYCPNKAELQRQFPTLPEHMLHNLVNESWWMRTSLTSAQMRVFLSIFAQHDWTLPPQKIASMVALTMRGAKEAALVPEVVSLQLLDRWARVHCSPGMLFLQCVDGVLVPKALVRPSPLVCSGCGQEAATLCRGCTLVEQCTTCQSKSGHDCEQSLLLLNALVKRLLYKRLGHRIEPHSTTSTSLRDRNDQSSDRKHEG